MLSRGIAAAFFTITQSVRLERMSDNDFAENPFRALNLKFFPDKKKNSAGNLAPQAEKGRKRHVAAAMPDEEDLNPEDAALFLRAMNHVQQGSGKQKGRARGFCLGEQCELPTAAERKKKPAAGQMAGQVDMKESALSLSRDEKKLSPLQRDAVALSSQHARGESADDAEAAAFLQAMGEVRPLQARGRQVSPEPRPGTPPPQGELSLQDFMDGKLEFALSFTDEYLEGHVVGLDQMIMNKLRAGGLSPEAHLDLHGLNAAQAFEALRGFMRACWYKGLRTVLVVPGRGRNSPDGMGVLREKLQSWLTQDPFKRVVLAFCTAQPHDGGAGSVYMLLRKYRKKGRIYWERTPADADLY